MNWESHLSDEELLLAADGELSAARAAKAAVHLEHCWSCRARRQELEGAVADFVRTYRDELSEPVAPVAGPKALLRARLAELAAVRRPWWRRGDALPNWRYAAVACLVAGIVAAGYALGTLRVRTAHAPRSGVVLPEPRLTPGAVVRIGREQVCEADLPKNHMVPVALQRRVFEEYGIRDPRTDAYEVDYLITPALGGADDIRNLWPQAYASTVWNAEVKDALEDRMRDLVCRGDLNLAVAQQEIASDWIAAYKKYFHTERPIEPGRFP